MKIIIIFVFFGTAIYGITSTVYTGVEFVEFVLHNPQNILEWQILFLAIIRRLAKL